MDIASCRIEAELVNMLLRDGMLTGKEGTRCPVCQVGELSKLQVVVFSNFIAGDRGPEMPAGI